ncbi:MAG: hypothetical protein K6G83_10940 [Lachnospiraceae bacterium]|nr:hypothetical protein [Lachnospiraceae bacterium]
MKISELLQKLSVGEQYEKELLLKEETDLPVDMLQVIMPGYGSIGNTGLAEYYFYGEEKPEVFACRITLVTEVLPENVDPLCTEFAVTNFSLPFGCFSYDFQENAVVYTFQVPLSDDLTDEEIIQEADACIRLAVTLAGGYVGQYEFFAKRRD